MIKTMWIVMALSLSIVTGCTVGTPSLSSLAEFSGITFSAEKKTSETYRVSTMPTCASELTITGQCDQRFNKVQFSIDEESTWMTASEYNSSSDGDCSDGKFSIYFPNVCTVFNVSDNGSASKKIYVRGDIKASQNVTREAKILFSAEESPVVKISILSPSSIPEGGTGTFNVNLDQPSSSEVTVGYSLSYGTATAADFTSSATGTVTFPPGVTSQQIQVATVNNAAVCEASKTFFVNIANPSSNAVINVNQASSTIEDPDRPTLIIVDQNSFNPGDNSDEEGSNISLQVTLSAVCPTHDIKFTWETEDGTATTSNSDYTPVGPTQAMIAKNTLISNIQIVSNVDTTFEPDEYFYIKLTNPIETTLPLDPKGKLYILNDDVGPTISIASSVFYTEGSPGNMDFAVSMSAASASTVTVNYTISNVTTTSADFSPGVTYIGTVTFNPMDVSETISLQIQDDSIDEPNQTFQIQLSAATGALISSINHTATGTIVDNDASPSISFSGTTTVAEAAGSVTYQAVLSAASEQYVTADYSISGGSATQATDYTSSTYTGSLSYSPGQTSKDISVAITDDNINEPNQTFNFNLSNPSNTSISSSLMIVTITDNDSLPSFSINDVSALENLNHTFTISLSRPSEYALSVDYTTNTNTTAYPTNSATASTDYTANSGRASFTALQTSMMKTVTITNDSTVEVDEFYEMVLSNPSNDTVGALTPTISDDIGIGQIVNNDSGISAPTSITLDYPASSPSVNSMPVFRVYGVNPTDVVRIFSASNCTGELGQATVQPAENDVLVSVASALVAGPVEIYANRTNISAQTSPCSAANFSYEYTPLIVNAAYPTSGANWNDYVSFGSFLADIYSQSGSACAGTEAGRMNQPGGCIHGGEHRKVVLNGMGPSCQGLTMVDNLSPSQEIFEWECKIHVSQTTFFSKGFKKGKGLRDLINYGSTPSWKPLSVVLRKNGTQISNSVATAWWSNLFVDMSLPGYTTSGSGPAIPLNESGKIYVVPSDRNTFGYLLDADKIALVTLGSSKIFKNKTTDVNSCSTSGTNATNIIDAVLCGSAHKFIWLEANLDGMTNSTFYANVALFAKDWSFSRIHNSTFSKFELNGTYANNASVVRLVGAKSNLLTELTLFDMSSGLELMGSTFNTLKEISIGNARGTGSGLVAISGIRLTASSSNNYIEDIRISNIGNATKPTNTLWIETTSNNNVVSRANISNIIAPTSSSQGIYVLQSSYNIFSQIIVAHTANAAIYMDQGSTHNIFSNLTTVANSFASIFFQSANDIENNKVVSLASSNADSQIISYMWGTPVQNSMTDIYLNNSINYSWNDPGYLIPVTGFFTTDNTGVCYPDPGTNPTCSTLGGTRTYNSSGNLDSAFRDKTGDSKNSETSGVYTSGAYSSLPAGSLLFENWARGWGADINLSLVSTGGPASTNLRIWDWRPSLGGPLHNKSHSFSIPNGTMVLNSADPCSTNTVSANDTIQSAGMTFLRNAIEINDDYRGNNNSLCESNEDCIWAPNIGAYQGALPRSQHYCIVDDTAGPGLDDIHIFTLDNNN